MTDASAWELDLHSVDLGDEDLSIEQIPEGVALGTFSTASSATTASCPVSSAGSIMTANCTG
ncbi:MULTISPECIES: thiocillin family RiPP [unclassified Streptomyces]|uniref:thiocillin family RiPP n=1 Tax=unclassified Streptomyces TaxID=2593676 RepID=UPI0022509724|nr:MULTISPECIES: thiocillin family RiPP [unclassified Streptomyces]MCX4587914.1 thiocillin family RiPP [Streptomyces sp. NBC_01481]HET6357063.1 thiocillin family RiPP [Streptomyces sp.]